MKKTAFRFVKFLPVILCIGFSAKAQIITTFAGTGAGYGGDGGAATSAALQSPKATIFDNAHNLYIADAANNRIRKINTSGVITTVAGTGTGSYGGDGGSATAAQLNSPTSIAFDSSGIMFIADFQNNRIRKVSTSGSITTVAGTGSASYGGDGGPASAAQLNGPHGVAVDNSGNIYIAELYGHRIRKINSSGIISTIAGTGYPGYTGDAGTATAAQLYSPWSVMVRTGVVYIGDRDNNRIRVINSSGIISTIAGTGATGYSGDGGAASAASIYTPCGITSDVYGNIFIADVNNNRIRKINTSGIISTVAGIGTAGLAGDGGAATAARINQPYGVAVDLSGNIYIADLSNNRIRKVTSCYPSVTGISGLDSICNGLTTILSDTTAGGTWSSSNAAIASINTSTGMVTGMGGGTSTITYSVTNACGTASEFHTITVNDLPHLTSPVALSVCDSMLLTYTPTSDSAGAAFAWSRSLATGISNAAATGTGSVYEYLDNTTAAPVNAIYNYATSLHGCVTNQAVVVTVNPTPYGVTTGLDTICIGMTATLYNSFTGGTGTWSSSNVAIATVSGTGIYFGVSAGNCNILYNMILNGCIGTTTYPVTILPAGKCPDAVAMLPGTISTSLALSPNPCNGSFTVTLSCPLNEEGTVIITNLLGQKVQEFQMHTNQPQEKQTRLLPGIYMLTATTKHDRFATKLVVDY